MGDINDIVYILSMFIHCYVYWVDIAHYFVVVVLYFLYKGNVLYKFWKFVLFAPFHWYLRNR